ncbi:MAG: DNA topoisomerase IB [Candidatus Sumerlaeaceae bacterium]
MTHATGSTVTASIRRKAKRKTKDLPIPAVWKAANDPVKLRCVSGDEPGFRRVKKRGKFVFLGENGKVVKDEAVLRRIGALVLPPAWKDVWITKHEDGHLQATGIDARGRKQYRYHRLWRESQDQSKYENVLEFGRVLPKIRARVEEDLKLPDLNRHKVLATVVRLLETTLIRVGNAEYARDNNSFGLTTMRDKHVQVDGCKIRFRFKGKSGKVHDIAMDNCELAKRVKKCRDVPGQELFQYADANRHRRSVTSTDVNAYLKQITGEKFTAKDFRTWAGTVLAALALRDMKHAPSLRMAKKNIVQAVEKVAMRLGNTPTICRKCYVHPAIFDSYLDGTLVQNLETSVARTLDEKGSGLDPDEKMVMRFLRSRLSEMVTKQNAKVKRKTKRSEGNGKRS